MTTVENFFDKLELKLDQIMHHTEKCSDAFFDVLESGTDYAEDGITRIMNIYESVVSSNLVPLKYVSLPWSLSIPITYKFINKFNERKIPLLVDGVHMIRAKVGGGKSLTSFVLADLTLKEMGVASYFTSAVEKPQLSEDGKYWYVMQRVIDLSRYYKKGKKVLNYNAKKYPYIHKDERHLDYNPRLNKKNEYNDRFVPEHADELIMRHDGFKAIYKYTQHLRLDSQEMETLTFMHEVETVKDIPILRWLNEDSFKYIPVKLKFITYTLEFEFDGTFKRKLYKKWSLPVPYSVLKRFETHAEKNKNAGLPVDYQ